MKRWKHSKIGIISFFLALLPIIYIGIQAIIDIYSPINTGFNKGLAISYFIMNFMLAISFISLVLGIVAITQKGYKKGLPISAVIISGLVLLMPIISLIKSIIEILNM